MNRILYRICKILNWIMPFFILILGDKIYTGYWLYVLIGYFAFSVFWFFGAVQEVDLYISCSFLHST